MLALWNTPHIPPGSICVRLAAAKPLAKTGLWQNHDNVFTTMEKDSKIYVAEHLELVGSALIRKLESEGYSNLITHSHSELDLTRQSEVEAFIESERPEYVLLAAAKVGGIWANNTYPAEFIYSNIAIQTNVIHASWRAGVKRLLFLGSSCFLPQGLSSTYERGISVDRSFGINQRTLCHRQDCRIKMCQSYNRQYGTKFLSVMPTNLYAGRMTIMTSKTAMFYQL